MKEMEKQKGQKTRKQIDKGEERCRGPTRGLNYNI